jgi:hypothetical protein
MNTMSKSLIAALALVGGLAGAGTASAQRWNGNDYGNGYGNSYGNSYGNGYGDSWRHPREQAAINRYLVDSTCSGQRGAMLENRLRLEVNRGQIGGGTARRIQSAINDLQYQERHECSERDYQSARDIGKDYIRIRAWIDQESGGNRGGYWRR